MTRQGVYFDFVFPNEERSSYEALANKERLLRSDLPERLSDRAVRVARSKGYEMPSDQVFQAEIATSSHPLFAPHTSTPETVFRFWSEWEA